MKKLFTFLMIGLLSFAISCKDSKKDETANNEETTKTEKCKLTLEDFRSFCGLKSGSTLDDAIKIYGKPDSTSAAEEGSYWAYFFLDTNYPLTIEVAEKDKKIWTVYFEILTLGDKMQSDIDKAGSIFKLSKCVASLVGQGKDYAKSVMPTEFTNEAKTYYETFIWDVEDFSIEVVLDFYYEQSYKCTRIMVYFFDQLPE
jgi:hypothetical protein